MLFSQRTSSSSSSSRQNHTKSSQNKEQHSSPQHRAKSRRRRRRKSKSKSKSHRRRRRRKEKKSLESKRDFVFSHRSECACKIPYIHADEMLKKLLARVFLCQNLLNPKQTLNAKPISFSLHVSPQKTQSEKTLTIMAAAVLTTPKTSSGGVVVVLKSTTSAAGILALLEEPQDVLKVHGLQNAQRLRHADELARSRERRSKSSKGCTRTSFSHRDLAALVASKVRSFSCRSYCKRESKVAFGDLLYVRKEMRRF